LEDGGGFGLGDEVVQFVEVAEPAVRVAPFKGYREGCLRVTLRC